LKSLNFQLTIWRPPRRCRPWPGALCTPLATPLASNQYTPETKARTINSNHFSTHANHKCIPNLFNKRCSRLAHEIAFTFCILQYMYSTFGEVDIKH